MSSKGMRVAGIRQELPLILAIFIISTVTTLAQSKVAIEVSDFPLSVQITEKWNGKICASATCNGLIDEIRHYLLQNGYINPNIRYDSNATEAKIIISPGLRYQFGQINLQQIPNELRNLYGNYFKYREPYNPLLVDSLAEWSLQFFENTGYPYAKINFDSIHFRGLDISGRYHVERGPYIQFDKVETTGIGFSEKWLMKEANLQRGEPFNLAKYQKLKRRLEKLGYPGKEPLNWEVDSGKAHISIPLKEQKTSSIDALLGWVGDPRISGPVIIGYLELDLDNFLKSGKKLMLNWQRFSIQSQYMELNYEHPRLFHTPLSWEVDFQLQKQDSVFLDRRFSSSLHYTFENQLKLGLGLVQGGTTPLSDSQNSFEEYPLINIDRWMGSAHLRWDSEKYRMELNLINGMATFDGQQEVVGESLPPNNRAFQSRVRAKIGTTKKINSTVGIEWDITAAALFSEYIFAADLYQLGGTYSLRGFAEREFRPVNYLSSQVNLFWSPLQDYFFYIFSDQAYLYLKETETPVYSGGLGFDLPVNESGKLTLLWGIGRRPNQNISLSESMIQIGYISKF